MAVDKQNGDIIEFLKKKDYIMVNNALGGGSFGKTVLLQDPYIDELFVAKKYEPEYDELKEQFYKNFLSEIKILYKLNHKNIVRVYNYYAYEDFFTGYILMEYIDGQNIADFINSYYSPLEDTTLDDVFIQLIDAFCCIEAHGIIHRDIREGNILISKDGVVKIIDFGIGKIIKKNEHESTDSLADVGIKRDASDTLPMEFYNGSYTTLTDMFYLAELFHRLIVNAPSCDASDFSYNDILGKMMEKRPENRYDSFKSVREAIGKYDFVNMEISELDKQIYQEFTNSVYNALVSYKSEPIFIFDISTFISRLEKALSKNAFEHVIQNNSDIISCIVECGYSYNHIQISTDVVKHFLDWFKSSTRGSQSLIMSNFISKISRIKVEVNNLEVPF